MSGSSPPARGTPRHHRASRPAHRFIPACAGNTHEKRPALLRRAVHPRLRGEHSCAKPRSANASGSSPPARGTLGRAGMLRERERFIPACAGNTRSICRALPHQPVHPRLRGEHTSRGQPRSEWRGSSPPARGTPVRRSSCQLLGRFIPACAGNTRPCRDAAPCRPVHPRLRGEHSSRNVLFHKAFYTVKKPTGLSGVLLFPVRSTSRAGL